MSDKGADGDEPVAATPSPLPQPRDFGDLERAFRAMIEDRFLDGLVRRFEKLFPDHSVEVEDVLYEEVVKIAEDGGAVPRNLRAVLTWRLRKRMLDVAKRRRLGDLVIFRHPKHGDPGTHDGRTNGNGVNDAVQAGPVLATRPPLLRCRQPEHVTDRYGEAVGNPLAMCDGRWRARHVPKEFAHLMVPVEGSLGAEVEGDHARVEPPVSTFSETDRAPDSLS